MANKITYTNKERLIDNPSIAEENKVTDTDMNEIKQVVNSNADELEDKVDKIEGKGLSTNDFTDEYKEQITALQTENTRLKATLPTTTGSGENITLDKTAEMDFVKPPLPSGNSEQETYEGYNILPINDLAAMSYKGVNFSISNQETTISGTSSDSANVELSITNALLKANTTYTLATITEGTSTATGTNISILLGNSSKSNIITCRAVPGTNIVTYTPTEDTQITSFRGYIGASGLTCNMKIKVMLLEGTYTTSNLPTYEPYTYGQAPNPDYPQAITNVTGDVEVLVGNKNLLYGNSTNTNRGITTTLNGNILTITGTTIGAWWTGIEQSINIPSGTYTVSIQKALPFTLNFILTLSDGTTKNLSISKGNLSATASIGANATKFNINFASAIASTDYNETVNLQLEKSSTPTTYTPHQEQALPLTLGNIELCKIGDYQDYIYKDLSNGKWYKYGAVGKVVLDGSENGWSKTNYAFSNNSLFTGRPLSLCSHFTNSNSSWISSDEGYRGKYSSTNTNNQFKCMPLIDMTLSDFKTWLSTHNTTVYYVYETPNITEITDTTLINQLEAIAEATSYEEQTNITGSSSEANPMFNVEAYQSIKLVLAEISNAVVALGGV